MVMAYVIQVNLVGEKERGVGGLIAMRPGNGFWAFVFHRFLFIHLIVDHNFLTFMAFMVGKAKSHFVLLMLVNFNTPLSLCF